MTDLAAVAKRAIASLDLTNLNDDCDKAAIDALTIRAKTDFGPVAAVCVWPDFVAQSAKRLAGTGIQIATVVNFPTGAEDAGEVMEMTRAAVANGATEIDMVIPYRDLLEGNEEPVVTRVKRVKSAAGAAPVKAILETGVLEDADIIRRAADLAIEGGADFIKTSTGKVPVNATLAAARVMLDAIKASGEAVGFKAAGGVKTTAQAGHYLDLADEIMGTGWATPATFRFGASGVLDDLLATAGGGAAPEAKDGY